MTDDPDAIARTGRGGNDIGGPEATPGQRRDGAVSRRGFLRATAGTAALTAALGAGAIGTAAAEGIPTPWLHREGKWIRDPSGNDVVLRGMNVPDAKRMNTKDFRPNADETIRRATNGEEGWHPRILRLPVQPTDIGDHDAGGIPPIPGFDQGQLETYVEKHLRPAVDLCAERGVYCIVDYHRHRANSDAHRYTSDETDQELTMFWETVAPEFAEDSHVLYEVYNEPIAPFQGRYDPMVDVDPTEDVAIETWQTWKEAAQPWVDTIREHAPRNLILIGSPRWSQWTYQAPRDEFDGDDLAYVGHVYAHPNMRPLSEYFGTPAEDVPVFMTEFGWGTYGADWLKGTPAKEGQQFVDLFEEYENMHWQVWCFDSKWSPAMMDHSWEINQFGEFWRDYLAEKRSDHLPEGDGTGPTPGEDTTAPTAPSNLTVADVSQTSLTIGWAGSTDSGGSGLAEYVVAVADRETTVAAGTTQATVAELAADTGYAVSVAAVDGAGNRSDPVTVTATTEGDGGETDVEPIDGTTPQDIDGDGQYQDLNANGDVDFDDVVIYFSHMSEPAMTDHVGAYDYNDNDEVDFADVVSLFGEVE